jgi:hypothetical protein
MIVQDLVIVVPDRAAFRDVLNHFDATDESVEIHLDRRRGERRRAAESPINPGRRKRERRTLDVSESLRTAGWVIVPAAQREATIR